MSKVANRVKAESSSFEQYEYQEPNDDDEVDDEYEYEWEYTDDDNELIKEKEDQDCTENSQPSDKQSPELTSLEDEEIPDPFTFHSRLSQIKPNDSSAVCNIHMLNGKNNDAQLKPTSTNGNATKEEISSEKTEKKEEMSKEERKRKHKKHKKSKHSEKINHDAEKKNRDRSSHEESKNKKIHVRSKDPSKIARQFEQRFSKSKSSKNRTSGHPVVPPLKKVVQICKICNKEPYQVERIEAENHWWHKSCFKCAQCGKILNLDSYLSHEGVIYCRPHHKELFQPKIVRNQNDQPIINSLLNSPSHKVAIDRRESVGVMETIIRENDPIDLGDAVVKCGNIDKYQGLEDLDVSAKFKMFESASQRQQNEDDSDSNLGGLTSSDRYGIMEKLRRLQDGEDFEDLLAEIEEDISSEDDQNDGDENSKMTEVQKKTLNKDKLFEEGGQERRNLLAQKRREEIKLLREKLMAGTRDNVLEQFEEMLSSSKNKIKKIKVDVKSSNAKRFREMFDRGQVPEALNSSDRCILEKEAELEQMRKGKREQRDLFMQMDLNNEHGISEPEKRREPKLLIRKIKHTNGSGISSAGNENDDDKDDDDDDENEPPEMRSLSNKFSFFEHFEEKREREREAQHKNKFQPGLLIHRKFSSLQNTHHKYGSSAEDENSSLDGEEGSGGDIYSELRKQRKATMTETDLAKKECRAKSMLSKFKEMENRALNEKNQIFVRNEDPDRPVMTALGFLGRLPGVGDRKRPMKRFTPPRKIASADSPEDGTTSESESDYSSDDDYSNDESYTSDSGSGSSYTESDVEEDETLKAIRETNHAKNLRAKFEEWEKTSDAREQRFAQLMIDGDDNDVIDRGAHSKDAKSTSKLRQHFESTNIRGEEEETNRSFRVKRFK